MGGLILPSTYSELNYGDMNNFVSPMIRTINTFGDTSFEKLNWPKKIMYGTFCVNVYGKNIIQEIYGLNGYAFRLYVSDVWSEWIEFEKTS